MLKQEQREAYKEIELLMPGVEPLGLEINKRKVTLYDMHDLVGWDGLENTFRAVVSDEEWYEWKMNSERKKERVLKTSHWRWLTNMPSIYKAEIIYRLGHGRWEEEESRLFQHFYRS